MNVGVGIDGRTAQPRTHRVVESPLGPLVLVAQGEALAGVYVHRPPSGGGPALIGVPDPTGFAAAAEQLVAYFDGSLTGFDLPLLPAATEFQRAVREQVLRVAPGDTVAYGELARRIGRPQAARAVGLVNARNPLSIVVPCHRVVGAAGRPVGSVEAVERKLRLLAHERG